VIELKQSVYDNTSISSVSKETTELHFVRPMKASKTVQLIERLPLLSKISMSRSCFERFSPKAKKIISEKEIQVNISSERGRAIEIPLKKMLHVIELARDHRPLREIEETTGVPKSTAHYLVRYASRKKIKQGGKTVYFE